MVDLSVCTNHRIGDMRYNTSKLNLTSTNNLEPQFGQFGILCGPFLVPPRYLLRPHIMWPLCPLESRLHLDWIVDLLTYFVSASVDSYIIYNISKNTYALGLLAR